MKTLLRDLRYGFRVLSKSRGFALVAVVTLALGIGASTAAFSVVHAVLLRPLPFPEQERLFVAWKRDATTDNPFVELSVAEVRLRLRLRADGSGRALAVGEREGDGALLLSPRRARGVGTRLRRGGRPRGRPRRRRHQRPPVARALRRRPGRSRTDGHAQPDGLPDHRRDAVGVQLPLGRRPLDSSADDGE